MDVKSFIDANNKRMKAYIEQRIDLLGLKEVRLTNTWPAYDASQGGVLWLVEQNGQLVGLKYNDREFRGGAPDLSAYVRRDEILGMMDSWMENIEIINYIPGATTTSAGLMRAADKVKLDALRNYNPPSYTALPLDSYSKFETDGGGRVVRAVKGGEEVVEVYDWSIDTAAECDPTNPAWDGTYLRKRIVLFEDMEFQRLRLYGIGQIMVQDDKGNVVYKDLSFAGPGDTFYANTEYELLIAPKGSQVARVELTLKQQ